MFDFPASTSNYTDLCNSCNIDTVSIDQLTRNAGRINIYVCLKDVSSGLFHVRIDDLL